MSRPWGLKKWNEHSLSIPGPWACKVWGWSLQKSLQTGTLVKHSFPQSFPNSGHHPSDTEGGHAVFHVDLTGMPGKLACPLHSHASVPLIFCGIWQNCLTWWSQWNPQSSSPSPNPPSKTKIYNARSYFQKLPFVYEWHLPPCSESVSQQQAAGTDSLTYKVPQNLPFYWHCLAGLKHQGSKRNF